MRRALVLTTVLTAASVLAGGAVAQSAPTNGAGLRYLSWPGKPPVGARPAPAPAPTHTPASPEAAPTVIAASRTLPLTRLAPPPADAPPAPSPSPPPGPDARQRLDQPPGRPQHPPGLSDLRPRALRRRARPAFDLDPPSKRPPPFPISRPRSRSRPASRRRLSPRPPPWPKRNPPRPPLLSRPSSRPPPPSPPPAQTPAVQPTPDQAPAAPAAQAAADPMAPRRDAPIYRLMRPQTGVALDGAAVAGAQQAAQLPPGEQTARYYSVHRQAGRHPDTIVTPQPTYWTPCRCR